MHAPIPELRVGLILAAIWLCIVAIAVIGYFIVRRWRRTHPLPDRAQTYSRQLPGRFNSAKARPSRD